MKNKKRKKVFYLPDSPMAKSLQRWKDGWENYPESMELRRKRGVEKNSKGWKNYRNRLWQCFVYEIADSEISPEKLRTVCESLSMNSKQNGTKVKSLKAYLTKWGFIKWLPEKDSYLNLYRIKHEEESRAQADRRNAQQAEEERLAVERLEAEKLEREAQQRHREETERARAQQSPAHRVTQSQQPSQPEISELEGLKRVRERTLKSISWSVSQAEKETDPARAQGWEKAVEISKNRLSKIDLQIYELENCGKKLSEGIAIES